MSSREIALQPATQSATAQRSLFASFSLNLTEGAGGEKTETKPQAF